MVDNKILFFLFVSKKKNWKLTSYKYYNNVDDDYDDDDDDDDYNDYTTISN